MLNQHTLQLLTQLKLDGMARAFEEQYQPDPCRQFIVRRTLYRTPGGSGIHASRYETG